MTRFKPILLAGLAAVAVAGAGGIAYAASPHVRTITLPLPGGGVEQIAYSGTRAPQVVIAPAQPAEAATPVLLPLGGPDPFAMLAQISAMMDQQMAAVMNAVDMTGLGAVPGPGALTPAAFAALPPGGASYAFVSSVSGGSAGPCMQSLEITMTGGGGAPHVVRSSSGACGADVGLPGVASPPRALPAALPPAARPLPAQPGLIRVRYLMPHAPSALAAHS